MPLAGASPIDYFTIQRHQAAGIKAEARHLNHIFALCVLLVELVCFSVLRFCDGGFSSRGGRCGPDGQDSGVLVIDPSGPGRSALSFLG